MAVRKVEAELEKLGLLRDAPEEEAATGLRKALSDRVNVMVAKAAKIAAERQMREMVPDLLRAFDRLFDKPVERDPQCWGKNAIAKALVDLDYRESAPFLRGMRHVQMEPVWGGQEDTAETLRSTSVLALATCTDLRRETVLRELVDRMADDAVPVRVEAARAVAQMGGDEAYLLLRLKARAGDQEPRVLGQVFDSLLQVERAEGLPFVGSFLESKDEAVRAEAALSIGTSRMAGTFELLRSAWEQRREEVVLRAMSASRQDEAIAFVQEIARDGRPSEAKAAKEALGI
jgi:HEAT repeat protein